MYKIFKYPFYKVLDYIIESDYLKEKIRINSKNIFLQDLRVKPKWNKLEDIPEQYRINIKNDDLNAEAKKPIFITARFRSGSTFLWLLFRNIKGEGKCIMKFFLIMNYLS